MVALIGQALSAPATFAFEVFLCFLVFVSGFGFFLLVCPSGLLSSVGFVVLLGCLFLRCSGFVFVFLSLCLSVVVSAPLLVFVSSGLPGPGSLVLAAVFSGHFYFYRKVVKLCSLFPMKICPSS